MVKRQSAGILLYRFGEAGLQVFLVHPGGPFWKNKDEGAWSIPKGEFTEEEEPLAAARREFEEETGVAVTGSFIELTPAMQKAGKLVHAWAVEGDIDAEAIRSNTYKMQWPPKSGKWQNFPEVDKAGWFGLEEAMKKINSSQALLLQELAVKVSN